MSAQGTNPGSGKKDKGKAGKEAEITKKDPKISEEDLRKISGGVEPMVRKPSR